MITMRKNIALFSIIALMSSCGESITDTYKDYAGDGEIRYVGKVSDLNAKPGWQHIMLDWQNSKDPIVDSVEIKWVAGDVRDSIFLPAGTDSYDIRNLTSGSTYEISVMSVDKNKNESLPQTAYLRVYNEDHEQVQAFTRVISKSYFLKNHLLMTFTGWSQDIEEAYLTYTKKSTGKEERFDLTEDVVDVLHADIPDVDITKPVLLYRNGYIQDCSDLIVNSPIEIDKETAFDSEFKDELKRQFGYDQIIPESWTNNVETLDIDWNMTNLLDLFKMPKLKTLNLGKNRYVRADQQNDAEKGQSRFVENDVTDWVLAKMHELTGLEVNRYDNHYKALASASYIHHKAHAGEPSHKMIDMSKAKVTVLPADDEELTTMGWNSHAEYLVDGKDDTSWKPYAMDASTEYTIDINIGGAKKVSGMRFVQSYYPDAEASSRVLSPEIIKIYKSANGLYYPIATYREETHVGNSTGEVSFINFAEATEIENVRIVVVTPAYFKKFQISIAEVGLFE